MLQICEFEHQLCCHSPANLSGNGFITDAFGDAHQHLQYLPYGEDFISQRIDWQTRYTFFAKEKDKNTGYHYFGARYYDSENSLWLSVDRFSDKYPSFTPYQYGAQNPLLFVDPTGDTIRLTDKFRNNENAMRRYEIWSDSKAGKRFHRRYEEGGKHEDVLVEFDLMSEGEKQNNPRKDIADGVMETFARKDGKIREIYKGDKVDNSESLKFRIALNSSHSNFKSKDIKGIRDNALTILHETQHLRIEHYSILMFGIQKYSSVQQHYLMRTNLKKGSFYNGHYLPPNGIYDFNAERWQFLDEYRLPGESNIQIESLISDFLNY